MFTANKKYYRSFCVFVICLTVSFTLSNCLASSGQFELNCPYWFMLFDSAGYMDITEWYPSERHLLWST